MLLFLFSRGIIKPGSTHSNEFDAEVDIGTIQKVKFLWNNHVVNPTFPKVGASKITVQKGDEKTVYVPFLVPEGVCRDPRLQGKRTPESQLMARPENPRKSPRLGPFLPRPTNS